jgi:hypothetical protein
MKRIRHQADNITTYQNAQLLTNLSSAAVLESANVSLKILEIYLHEEPMITEHSRNHIPSKQPCTHYHYYKMNTSTTTTGVSDEQPSSSP